MVPIFAMNTVLLKGKMKIRPIGNFGEVYQGFTKQKRHKHKKHKQWQRFKRKRTKHFGSFSKFNDCSSLPIMNPSSFWDNYASVLKWQQDYYTSYWKSRAITLENEVHHLRTELDKYHYKNNPRNESSDKNENEDDCILVESDDGEQREEQPVQVEEEDDEEIYDEDDDIGVCDFKIVVSDEMQEYLNKKAEGESQNSVDGIEIIIDESENSDSEGEIIFEKTNDYRMKRNVNSKQVPDFFCSDDDMIEITADEKKKMYGIHLETINAMETAVQLSYLSFRKKTNPSYWPNLPLVIKLD